MVSENFLDNDCDEVLMTQQKKSKKFYWMLSKIFRMTPGGCINIY